MNILVGIDPGLANFGYAFVELLPDGLRPIAMGVIRTEKSDKKLNVLASDDNARRGREVASEFSRLLGIHSPAPPVAFCVEAKSFPRNASAAAKTAISWGIIIANAARYDIPIFQARPQEIKQSMCGKKSASKKEIQDAVDEYFTPSVIHPLVEGLTKTRLEHPYDAAAAVVVCSDSEALRMVRRMS